MSTAGVHARIGVVRRSVWRTAPEAFFFEISDLAGFNARAPQSANGYNPQFHELYYFWNFGDAYKFEAPQNLPSTHKNADVAYGPWVSHTFRTPGTYSVSCLIVEPKSGKSTTATLDVVVGEPERVFGERDVIFLSPAGDFRHAPRGAIGIRSDDISRAIDGHAVGQEQSPKRIILNRGESYKFRGLSAGLNAHISSLHIIAGSGSDPKPRVALLSEIFWNDQTTGQAGPSKDLVLQNLLFNGGFDSTSRTDPQSFANLLSFFEKPPYLTLLDGCEIGGVNAAVVIGSSNGGHATVINDTIITNYSFGVLDAAFEAFAITGSAIYSHPAALVDSSPNQGWGVRFGGRAKLSVVQSSDFFSRQGWSPNGTIKATQPCVRFNSEGFEGARVSCQTSAFEGGTTVLGLSVDRHQPHARPGNALIEKNYIVGGYQTATMVAVEMGGTTARNNILVMPDATGQRPPVNNPYAFFGVENPGGHAGNAAAPFRFYNNTMVNVVGRATYHDWGEPIGNMVPVIVQSGMKNVGAGNNVVYQTETTQPAVSDAPLAQDSNAFFKSRELGYRSTKQDLRATTATRKPRGLLGTYAPVGQSPALGDALQDPVAYDDYWGRQRPSYPSRGALEMP